MAYFNINKMDYSDLRTSILYRLTFIDDGQTWQGNPVVEDFFDAYNADGQYVSFFTPIGQIHVIEEGPNQGRYTAGPVKYADEPIENPNEIYDYKQTSSTIIYSDDQGEIWHMDGISEYGGNEASAVAIDEGNTILMIRRRNTDDTSKRIVNYSYDCGLTWTPNIEIDDIPSPRCLGVMKKDGNKLIYSTPKIPQPYPRMMGWIGISLDEGQTWKGNIVQPGLFSYSDVERIKGTDNYLVSYSHAMHDELGLYVKRFKEWWLLSD
ncbi:MAG: exo-alpha-sialidase [Desulfobacterales bacterium]|nr:exo-alpha-sialidase [Desulfobacterales bacterium]